MVTTTFAAAGARMQAGGVAASCCVMSFNRSLRQMDARQPKPAPVQLQWSSDALELDRTTGLEEIRVRDPRS